MNIRPATEADAQALVNIYNPYIKDTLITFEYTEVSAEEFAGRIRKVLEGGYPYLVAEENDRILGYSYATQFRTRAAYRFTVETTIYLDRSAAGKGIGTSLYGALLDELRKRKFHLAIGGITLPNPPSQALHEKLGFKQVASFHEVGYKFDQWVDVGFWELKL